MGVGYPPSESGFLKLFATLDELGTNHLDGGGVEGKTIGSFSRADGVILEVVGAEESAGATSVLVRKRVAVVPDKVNGTRHLTQ